MEVRVSCHDSAFGVDSVRRTGRNKEGLYGEDLSG
jgi:hypothetical protein